MMRSYTEINRNNTKKIPHAIRMSQKHTHTQTPIKTENKASIDWSLDWSACFSLLRWLLMLLSVLLEFVRDNVFFAMHISSLSSCHKLIKSLSSCIVYTPYVRHSFASYHYYWIFSLRWFWYIQYYMYMAYYNIVFFSRYSNDFCLCVFPSSYLVWRDFPIRHCRNNELIQFVS